VNLGLAADGGRTDIVLDALMDWLKTNDGPLGYAVLGLAAMVEYIFPPLPGDAITLFGAFLAATAGYHPALVWVALWVGSMIGGMGAYAFGRHLSKSKTGEYPRLLRGKKTKAALRAIEERFEKHGAIALALNRFVPALRGFFFIGAGIARLPAAKVFLWGGLSAAVWNVLILVVGYLVGNNWDRLETLATRYAIIVFAVIGAAIAAAVTLWLIRKRRRAAA
jgi:membrane protein DedA with SNARE-associated domain